jgi:HEAT repeat protein/lysophospholipase L1-like esterase
MAPAAARRYGFLANLTLAVVVTALLIWLLEGGARYLDQGRPAAPVADYIWNWDDKWEGDFYRMRSDANGWPPWEEFNADGLRDRTHPEEKPAGMRRVVFLGDSVTAGAELEPDEAFPQVLEQRLDQEGRPVEVFNVALWGWSTRQQRIAYERLARKYRPDDVFLAVCLNDIPELQNNLTRPPRFVSALFRRSALFRLIVDAPGREIQSVEQLFQQPDSGKVHDGMSRFFDEVRALRNAVREDGASLAIVVFPFRFQVAPGAPPPVVQQRIAAFCAAEGLPCLDLLPAIRGMGEAAFIDYDHLSPAGARLVASAIERAPLFPAVPSVADRLPPGADVPRLVAALKDADPGVRRGAAWALGRQGRRAAAAAVPALAAALGDRDESVRRDAARALGRLGDAGRPARPALFRALCDERASVRWRAAQSLSSLDVGAGAVPDLVLALRNEDPYVRGFAAWTLGAIGPDARAAVPALVDALQRDDGYERGGAAAALARMGPAALEAVPALLEGLRSTDGDRRWKAARTLGRIGPAASAAVPDLTSALGDGNEYVRAHAARALGRMGTAADPAARALQGAMNDPDKNVRREAKAALKQISNGRNVD